MNDAFQKDLMDVIRSLRGALELEKSFGMEVAQGKTAKRKREKTGKISLERHTLEDELAALRQTVSVCVKCALHRGRTQTVFGEGSFKAKLMFVGEAPGMSEDLEGRPFVGQAGKLLTKIIEAMGMKRGDVYIANVIKCRPPGNRGPLPEEVHTCTPYLAKQIEILRPRIICTLGKYATDVLVHRDNPISALRGQFYDYEGIPVMPTYHPAYLLRNPSAKRMVWEDMKKIKAALERIEAS